jgi:hypothetical protein
MIVAAGELCQQCGARVETSLHSHSRVDVILVSPSMQCVDAAFQFLVDCPINPDFTLQASYLASCSVPVMVEDFRSLSVIQDISVSDVGLAY